MDSAPATDNVALYVTTITHVNISSLASVSEVMETDEDVSTSPTKASVLVSGGTSPSFGVGNLPSSTYALAIFVASFMFLITVIPNIMIIMLVIVDRKLRRLSNYYIISLAVADCIVGAVVVPCMASYTILGYWALGGIICDLWITFDFMCCTASMLSLCMISLDRYWAITQPLKHRGRSSRKRALLYVAAIWIASALCWVPAIVVFRIVSGDFGQYDCVYLTDPIYVLISAILIYYVPMFTMVFLYMNVYIAVKKQCKSIETFEESKENNILNTSDLSATTTTDLSANASGRSMELLSVYTNQGFTGSTHSINGHLQDETLPPSGDVQNPNSINVENTEPSGALNDSSCPTSVNATLNSVSLVVAEGKGAVVTAEEMRKLRLRKTRLKHAALNRRTARTLGVIVTLFLICWLPFVVLFPINAFCNCIPGRLYDASYWLAYLNSTLNPFLYGFSLDFRKAFRRFFCKRCMTVPQDMSSADDAKF